MLRTPASYRLIPALIAVGLVGLGSPSSLRGQTQQSESIVVTGEEVPSSYGATPGFSRSRFSNLTQSYVLPPGAVFAGLIYQGDALRFNRPDHMLTQEIEFGLPNRFGLAFAYSFVNPLGINQNRTLR